MMEAHIDKPNYQWKYVFVSVFLAFFICGSFMLWNHKSIMLESGDLEPTRKLTSTTAQPTGVQDIVGKEPFGNYATKESTARAKINMEQNSKEQTDESSTKQPADEGKNEEEPANEEKNEKEEQTNEEKPSTTAESTQPMVSDDG